MINNKRNFFNFKPKVTHNMLVAMQLNNFEKVKRKKKGNFSK